MDDQPVDRCPYASRAALADCDARETVSLETRDSRDRVLAPALTCGFLGAGERARGDFYPRCELGDAAARAEFAMARSRALAGAIPPGIVPGTDPGSAAGGAAVLVADDSGRYVAVNALACELLRYERDALLSKSVWDLTPGAHRESGQAMWAQFIAAGSSYGRYPIICGDGTVREFDFMASANVTSGLHVSILRRPGRPRGSAARDERAGREPGSDLGEAADG